MAHGQGATSNRTGGRGPLSRGPRGHGTDKAVKKANWRERDDRIRDAAEETRKHQEELDALIKQQRENPAVGETAGARYQREMAEKKAALEAAQAEQAAIEAEPEPTPEPEPEVTAPHEPIAVRIQKFNPSRVQQQSKENLAPFAITQARQMLKSGYNVRHVIKLTGVGWEELSDIPVDEEGYGSENIKVIQLVDQEDEEDDDTSD